MTTSVSPSPRSLLAIGKSLLFGIGLLPLIWLGGLAWQNQLGTNPVETLSHDTGIWGLRFLLLTLAITPLQRLTGWHELLKFRRMLGLFAFFYTCLHLGVYLIFDQFFDWPAIMEDIVARPFITVGFLAWLLLLPLAATSTNSMMKRLGRHWQRLQRLVYFSGILSVLHYLWLVKVDRSQALLYAGILGVLLGYRVWWSRRAHSATARRSTR